MKLGCINNGFILIFLGILFLGQIFAYPEQEIGIDGLRCDSCGSECSSVCGSRQFRTCCFNYIKKRSDPALSPSGPSGHISRHNVATGDISGGVGSVPSPDERRWYSFIPGDIYKFEEDERAHPSRGRFY